VTPEGSFVVEFFGEGKTDIGEEDASTRPMQGVVPILVHALCGKPGRMIAKRTPMLQLQERGLARKVRFAKRLARRRKSAAAVFVVDTEGDLRVLKAKKADLEQGRNAESPDFPMAVGVAQPCIEAWLLADASAIRRAFDMPAAPGVPAEPEKCPAPCQNQKDNPKTILARIVGLKRRLSAEENWRIAAAMNDMGLVRTRCPASFAPLADEVEGRIRPLFSKSG